MIDSIKNNKNITLTDIAAEAGVGVATVDRVINGRAKVKESTKQQVLNAAERLGYHRLNLIKHQLGADLKELQLGFILQRRESYFYRELSAALEQACLEYRDAKITPHIVFLEELTPRSVSKAITQLSKYVNAIGVVAADHPLINMAIEEAQNHGVGIFTVLTDLTAQHRAGYIGIDNRSAGRTAAWAISKLAKQKGKVGLIIGSHRYLCQDLCEMSFRSYLRENEPEFQMVEAVASLENKSIAEDATLELLKQNPDLVGLYCAGGGVEGVLDALKDMPIAKDMVIVANELTPITRKALIDGTLNMVISHPREKLAQCLIERMADNTIPLSGRNKAEILQFEIYIQENV